MEIDHQVKSKVSVQKGRWADRPKEAGTVEESKKERPGCSTFQLHVHDTKSFFIHCPGLSVKPIGAMSRDPCF